MSEKLYQSISFSMTVGDTSKMKGHIYYKTEDGKDIGVVRLDLFAMTQLYLMLRQVLPEEVLKAGEAKQ